MDKYEDPDAVSKLLSAMARTKISVKDWDQMKQ